jgi:hypothetical protein
MRTKVHIKNHVSSRTEEVSGRGWMEVELTVGFILASFVVKTSAATIPKTWLGIGVTFVRGGDGKR